MRGATIQKLAISIALVGLYASVPMLAGAPHLAPAVFKVLIGGVPLSVWAVVVLLLGLPLVAWACARMMSDADGVEAAGTPPKKD